MKYAHTNLIARDWKTLSRFYREVFGCVPVPPERDMSGEWLDRVTGVPGAHIVGEHLRLPGCGEDGPTLEIFQYDSSPSHPGVRPNTPGFSHIAFLVDDMEATARSIAAHGGSVIGALVVREVKGDDRLAVQYLADPEGNIIEIQRKMP